MVVVCCGRDVMHRCTVSGDTGHGAALWSLYAVALMWCTVAVKYLAVVVYFFFQSSSNVVFVYLIGLCSVTDMVFNAHGCVCMFCGSIFGVFINQMHIEQCSASVSRLYELLSCLIGPKASNVVGICLFLHKSTVH